MSGDHSGELAGRVALVTGAARGQGRAISVLLAARGAAVIAVDLCAEIGSTEYHGATQADLDETASQIRAAGSMACTAVADVRDLPTLQGVVSQACAELGGLDIVVANAGIAGGVPIEHMSASTWQEMVDVNLTGAWNTVKASVPILFDRGTGTGNPIAGTIVLTSSANGGLKAPPNLSHYSAAKHGVVGLMRSLANELGPRGIRVNTIHPTAVATDMLLNDATYRLFRPDLEQPGIADVVDLFSGFHSLRTPWIEPIDVAYAVAFLVSDRARYLTGVSLAVDAGLSAR